MGLPLLIRREPVLTVLTVAIAFASLLSVPSLVTGQQALSISLQLSRDVYPPGSLVEVFGSVSAPSGGVAGATVSIQVQNPIDETIFVDLVYTDSNGNYKDSFTLKADSVEGIYRVYVTASKHGYSDGMAKATFRVITATVTTTTTTTGTTTPALTQTQTQTTPITTVTGPPRCIIATAAFSSELAPEVDFLKSFRDTKVMRTFAGRQFMEAFNAFYYSFSPNVAAFIASNGLAKEAVKLTLYPLLAILHAATMAFDLLSGENELAVILAGLLASSLIGLFYGTPALTLYAYSLNKRPKAFLERLALIARASAFGLLTALGLTMVSELLGSGFIASLSTSMLVLSSMQLAASGGTILLRKFFAKINA